MVKRHLLSRRARHRASEQHQARARELESENARLRARVSELSRLLDEIVEFGPDERPGRAPTERSIGDEQVGSVEAFEDFLSLADPRRDKIRSFLLG